MKSKTVAAVDASLILTFSFTLAIRKVEWLCQMFLLLPPSDNKHSLQVDAECFPRYPNSSIKRGSALHPQLKEKERSFEDASAYIFELKWMDRGVKEVMYAHCEWPSLDRDCSLEYQLSPTYRAVLKFLSRCMMIMWGVWCLTPWPSRLPLRRQLH